MLHERRLKRGISTGHKSDNNRGNSSKTLRFPRSKIWEALLATDQARSVMKQSSCVLLRRKGVWLTPWVRFRCFAIWQRPTPSPVSFRFIVVRQPSSSHASLLSVRRSRSSQVIIHRAGDVRGGLQPGRLCLHTDRFRPDADTTDVSLVGRVCPYCVDNNHSFRAW